MTNLEKVRKVLMKQLQDTEEGKQDNEKANIIIETSKAVIKSYNVELRADELKAETENYKNKVFEDDMQKVSEE